MDSNYLTITEEVVNGFIRGFNLIPPLYKYESITDAAAEMLAESKVQLDLDGVTKISVNAIRCIVKRQDNFCLGLLEITNDQAEALTLFRKKLSLNSIKNISLSALEILVSTPKELLSLDGLMSLSPEEASLLAQFRGDLSLQGILQLNQGVAKHLARHSGSLILSNLKTLPTEEIHQLIHHQGFVRLNPTVQVQRKDAYLIHKHFNIHVDHYSQECLLIDCLADGTDEAIEKVRKTLATFPRTLCIESLNVLECRGAKALSGFPGELQLPGLEELDPASAVFLAEHKGPILALDGLKHLTIPVAIALGKHRGNLSLRGLKSFEEGSLSGLAMHDGPLMLPLPYGGNDKFGWFKANGGKVFWNPSGIDYHDLGVVEEILRSPAVEIIIPEEVHFLSNTAISRLGYACRVLGRRVAAPGLRELNQDQVQLLTANHLVNAASGTGSLALDGLQELTECAAEALGKSRLDLSLSGLSDLSSSNIRHLTQDIRDLALCGLKSVDVEGCKHLSSISGQLRLNGIEALNVDCAGALSTHVGKLTLNGLSAISEDVLSELLRHVDLVELKGIRWMRMSRALLELNMKRSISLDSFQVFTLIREFSKFSQWKHYLNKPNSNLVSMANDPAMPELIARLLLEHIRICVSVTSLKSLINFLKCTVPFNFLEREILDVFTKHTHIPPNMAIDEILRIMSENHSRKCENLRECEQIPHFQEERKVPRTRNIVSRDSLKIFGIADDDRHTHSQEIICGCPELMNIIKVCCETAKAILASGVSGESNISCQTLVVLGSIFGKRLELPMVYQLCHTGAEALSMLESEIALDGIKEINEEIATILSKHRGYIFTSPISDWEDRSYYGGNLKLNGIHQIDVATASALAAHRGNIICLNGLKTISNAVAEELGRHKEFHKDCSYVESRRLELNGLLSLTPQSALSLSGCLDKDPWRLVDRARVQARFSEAMSHLQEDDDSEAAEILDAFIDLTILHVHQAVISDLDHLYERLRKSLETKFGKASRPWVKCVVHAARALANNELSSTDLILVHRFLSDCAFGFDRTELAE